MFDIKSVRILSAEPVFHKSSYSDGGGNCVEVAKVAYQVIIAGKVAATFSMYAVRDSENPQDPAQWYTEAEWAAFTSGIKDGEFD